MHLSPFIYIQGTNRFACCEEKASAATRRPLWRAPAPSPTSPVAMAAKRQPNPPRPPSLPTRQKEAPGQSQFDSMSDAPLSLLCQVIEDGLPLPHAIYMYVCIYVCMYVCIFAFYSNMFTYYSNVYVCMYVCMSICVYVCMSIYYSNIHVGRAPLSPPIPASDDDNGHAVGR